jgi:hypothetical protein
MVSRRFLRALPVWAVPGCLLFGFSGVMTGAPLTWEVVASLPPTPLGQMLFEGLFTYDADTGVASQWNIQPVPPPPPNELPPGFDGPHDPTCYAPPFPGFCVSDGISASNSGITFTHNDAFYGITWRLYLVFSAPLSDNGGTIPLVPACPPGPPNGEPTCGSVYTFTDEVEPISGGSVSVVPEPGTGLSLVLLIAPFLIACSRATLRDSGVVGSRR